MMKTWFGIIVIVVTFTTSAKGEETRWTENEQIRATVLDFAIRVIEPEKSKEVILNGYWYWQYRELITKDYLEGLEKTWSFEYQVDGGGFLEGSKPVGDAMIVFQSQHWAWSIVTVQRITGKKYHRRVWIKTVKTKKGWLVADCSECPNVSRGVKAIKNAITLKALPNLPKSWSFKDRSTCYWDTVIGTGVSDTSYVVFYIIPKKDDEPKCRVYFEIVTGEVGIVRSNDLPLPQPKSILEELQRLFPSMD